jgi:hypothetical protein
MHIEYLAYQNREQRVFIQTSLFSFLSIWWFGVDYNTLCKATQVKSTKQTSLKKEDANQNVNKEKFLQFTRSSTNLKIEKWKSFLCYNVYSMTVIYSGS